MNQFLVETGGNVYFEFVQTAMFYGEPGTMHQTEGMYCRFEQRWRSSGVSEGTDYYGGQHQHGFEPPADTRKNNGPKNCVGNPINAANGNKYHSDLDYSHGVLELRRAYNRYGSGSGAFGTNWDATYFTAVSQGGFGADRALINRADGRVLTFRLNGSQWQADADVADRLVELKDAGGVRTGWKYTVAADDTTETYGANGKLTQIATRAGVLQTLGVRGYLYNEAAYTPGFLFTTALTGVVDESGSRFATFRYDSAGRAYSTEHAGGTQKYQIAFGTNGSNTVTDPLGTVRTHAFELHSQVFKLSSLSQPCSVGCDRGTRLGRMRKHTRCQSQQSSERRNANWLRGYPHR